MTFRTFALAVLLALTTPLHAAPIEALPDRVWTSRNGTRLEARLIWYPRQLAPDSVLELLPVDPGLPLHRVRIADLTAEDARHVQMLGENPVHRLSYRDLTKTDFRYDDGSPITGTFSYFLPLDRLIAFETREKPPHYWLRLEDLATESQALITANYLVRPNIETTLAESHPLPTNRHSPARFDLKNVPLIKQVGRYCVPASAAMIAKFHGINVDQRELAHLSSAASSKHKGTYAGDMLNAMEAFGFHGESKLWSGLDTQEDQARFARAILPFIRVALQDNGPLYVSFKPGVYGDSGHGCVITGYNDHGKGEIEINNPWGRREKYNYEDFAIKAREVVRFQLPPTFRGDSSPVEPRVMAALHRMPHDLTDAMKLLTAAGLKPALRLHGRRDRSDDRFETERWALAQGRRVVHASLERNPIVLLPATREGRIVGWYLLRKETGDPIPLVRPRSPTGWREPGRPHIDSVLNTWSTPLNVVGESSWNLPLIEIEG